MVLASGVIIRALHERANFYSACVYLAQSNACLMVGLECLYLRQSSHAHVIISGTYEYSTPRRMLWNAWIAEALLRPITSDRSRTALRKGMVCHHGNMSCNDHISRGGGRLVFGHVCLPVDRQGVGLDWRGTGRNSGAATTIESALVPCSTLRLPYHLEPI